MLIKHGTPMAREAVFPAPVPNSGPVQEGEARQPSEQDIALTRITRENEALRDEMAASRARWAEEIAAAELRARETAAREQVRDDAKRLDVLVAELAETRRQFEEHLVKATGRSATDLAVRAMNKLFEVRAEDADLLASVISRRLASLDEKAIVELALSTEDADGPARARVTEMLPRGTRITTDTLLRTGTARVQLRLGSTLIDPAAGFDAVLALLTEGADNA